MREWWLAREPRERWLLGGGALAAVALLAYALLWIPFQRHLDDARQSVAALRQDLAWMQQAAQQLRQLETARATARGQAGGPAPSLLTLVDLTARSAGLGTALNRVEPQGDRQVRVRLEQAAFDTLLRWLAELERSHGVTLVNASLERLAESGRVSARLVLQGPGA
ncbi:MAG TPA: type II secretion system protein M [Candidatus Competibacteraceae bacterium]|nr:type II secretion system protein M [Candidatus Competibacteraceae bacterium]